MRKLTAGAMNELVAAVDLMRRGYEVYLAASRWSSCDLVAVKGEKVYRIEVRTGRPGRARRPDSRIDEERASFGRYERDAGRQDLFAVVATFSGEVTYVTSDGLPLPDDLPESL